MQSTCHLTALAADVDGYYSDGLSVLVLVLVVPLVLWKAAAAEAAAAALSADD
jgi:hypothetical protein